MPVSRPSRAPRVSGPMAPPCPHAHRVRSGCPYRRPCRRCPCQRPGLPPAHPPARRSQTFRRAGSHLTVRPFGSECPRASSHAHPLAHRRRISHASPYHRHETQKPRGWHRRHGHRWTRPEGGRGWRHGRRSGVTSPGRRPAVAPSSGQTCLGRTTCPLLFVRRRLPRLLDSASRCQPGAPPQNRPQQLNKSAGVQPSPQPRLRGLCVPHSV